MTKIISPEKFEQIMLKYADQARMDNFEFIKDEMIQEMCSLLSSLGYSKGVEVYEDIVSDILGLY